MTAVKFSTDHVDYLQRNNYAPPPIPAQTPMTTAPPNLRRLWHICGVGKNQRNASGQQSVRGKSGWEEKEREYSTAMMNEQLRLPSEDVLIGLAGFRMPVAFLVVGQERGVRINLGTWSQKERENASPAVLNSRCHVVGTLLESLYPAVDMQMSKSVQLPPLALGGQVLGVPTIKQADPRVAISTHIDLLKSVFNASFGMWNPLPQVLERCLHTIYRDYGWDPVRGTNSRLSADAVSREQAFPTLTDLYYKVGEIVDGLGYEDRVTSDIKASLMTRLNSLRIGGKGVMLDTQRSIPMTELLSRPTVIELEPIGDDDEKAFLMGLLLIRLYEHRRVTGSLEGTGLNHVVVVEEAHRLLANVPPSANQEQSNVRGKAVETFSNMLSEIRAYGEGFLVAEQIPSKLALDVIKNTNIKIVHRIVAGDDRQVLGETMNMDPQQREMLSTLRVGQAAVFSEGDDRPILVSVPYAKITVPKDMRTRAGSDRVVAKAMEGFRRQPHIARCLIPFDRCPHSCGEPYQYCEQARELVGQWDFQNQFVALVQSLAIQDGAPNHFAKPLAEYLTARLPQGTAGREAFSCVVMNAVRWFLATYGRYYRWNYVIQEKIRVPLVEALLNVLPPLAGSGSGLDNFEGPAKEFSNLYRQACRRAYDPFPACTAICPNGECLFRFQAQKLLGERHLSELFDEAMKEAAEGQWVNFIAIDQAISRLVSFDVPLSVQRSTGLCYGMQKIIYKPGLMEQARRMAVQRLVEGFDLRFISERGLEDE